MRHTNYSLQDPEMSLKTRKNWLNTKAEHVCATHRWSKATGMELLTENES